jgi:O-acetyl-ADP-ribose deacetylase (regulator of RNase III)
MGRFILREIEKDIFTMDESYYLGHCISADYELGKGVAAEFEKHFELREKLLEMGEREYPDCILIGRVFNLVTKLKYNHKPTMSSMRQSLILMRSLVIAHSIRKVAIVKIGCGLDKLEWTKVKEAIEETFKYVDCEIVVCNYSPDKHKKSVKW